MYFIETHCCGRRIPSDVLGRNQTFLGYTVLSTMRFNKVSGYSHHMSPGLSSYSVHNIRSFGKVLYLTQCVPATPVMEYGWSMH